MSREWKGIQINDCKFQGTIMNDPVTTGNFTFMTLRTKRLQRDVNGQFTEVEQLVPLMISPGGPTNVVPHIQAGRRLHVTAVWITWQDEHANTNYAFDVVKVELGSKPHIPKDNIPDLP
jgi:hypothetical protein